MVLTFSRQLRCPGYTTGNFVPPFLRPLLPVNWGLCRGDRVVDHRTSSLARPPITPPLSFSRSEHRERNLLGGRVGTPPPPTAPRGFRRVAESGLETPSFESRHVRALAWKKNERRATGRIRTCPPNARFVRSVARRVCRDQ